MTAPPEDAPAAPSVILDPSAIRSVVDRLAIELGADHDDQSILVSVLKGSLIFTSDLARRLRFNPRIDFVAMSTFEGGGRARLVKDLSLDIEGAKVVLVHDAIDTGLSTSFLLDELARHRPSSLSVCTLIDKPAHRLVPLRIDYVGVTVEDDFLIGYGLDFAGRYRNLGLIAAADPDRLSLDPDCYVEWAHRRNGLTVRGEGDPASG